MYEFTTVVSVRSYSYISGITSEEMETGMPGSTSAAISRMRRSWTPLAKALMSDTVSASTPLPTKVFNLARISASSSGWITSPWALTRSFASIVRSSGASGSGLL